MKNWEMVRDQVKVEARGSVAVLTCSSLCELRLLGTSCHTDVELYKVAKSVMISLEKGKKGVVALSVCSPDKKYCGRGIFPVEWVGESKNKIFVNLMNPLPSSLANCGDSSSENGFEVYKYRIPWIFWGDSELSLDSQKVLEQARSYTGVGYKLFRDGNVFCRYVVGDANTNDVEAAHMEYRMEDPGFLKQIAKEVVILRQQVAEKTETLKAKELECGEKQKEINKRVSQFRSVYAILDDMFLWTEYISGNRKNTWWNKLGRIKALLDSK